MSSPKPPGFKQRRAWHFVELSDPVGPVRLGSVIKRHLQTSTVAPRPQIWSSQFPWALGRRWRHPKMPWTMAPWPSCRPSPWQCSKMAKWQNIMVIFPVRIKEVQSWLGLMFQNVAPAIDLNKIKGVDLQGLWLVFPQSFNVEKPSAQACLFFSSKAKRASPQPKSPITWCSGTSMKFQLSIKTIRINSMATGKTRIECHHVPPSSTNLRMHKKNSHPKDPW